MRVVIDTNVFVSALLQGPTPRRVYDAFLSGDLIPVFSPATLNELINVLTRPEIRALTSKAEITRFLTLIRRDGLHVRPSRRITVCRDEKDNILLECAMAGRAACIVTGDRDLLVLHPFRGIPIFRPSDFLQLLP